MNKTAVISSVLAMGITIAGPVAAQDNQSRSQTGDQSQANSVEVLRNWTYDPLYNSGISVDRMLWNADLYGPEGDEIGTVENVIFSDKGDVLAIIAQVGGFWDIGDTHVSIPWNKVEVGVSEGTVSVPVTEESVDDYSLFDEGWFNEETYFASDAQAVNKVSDDLDAGPTVFRASEVIGDYAYLDGGETYGYINDIVITEGSVGAVVIDANTYYGEPGYYAYPYSTANAGTVGDRRYTMPYTSEEIGDIESFDYGRMDAASQE